MALGLNELKPFIDWMQANPGLSAIAVFFISCAESLAIIGLFIPGTIVMPAIGSMIGAGVLPAHWIILAAILGAIIGDNLSYWLGFAFHNSLKKIWPFKHFPNLMENGEIFFNKYGGLSVFIGRFVGPVRPVIPVIAGMLNMPPVRFFIANVTSAIAWAILYMAPGILLGAISEQLAPHVAARLLVILAIITLGIWIAIWIINKSWNYIYKFIEKLSGRLWRSLSNRWPVIQHFVQHHHLNNHKPLSILLYILFFVTLLTGITISVADHGIITYLDWPIFLFLRSIQIYPLDVLMACLFNLSSPLTLFSTSFAMLAWLAFRKDWRATCYCLMNFFFSILLSKLLQSLLSISSPLTHSTHAYPSLPLTAFAAILGNFLLLSYYHRIWLRYKKYLLLFMLLLFSIAALPKLYFGFNWLSGTIASLGCAAIPTWCAILLFHRIYHPKQDLKPLLFIVTLASLIAVTTSSVKNTDNFLTQQEQPEFTETFSMEKWWGENAALPIQNYRTNFLGLPTEPFVIQYAGQLKALESNLQKEGWEIAPKPDLIVLLNRIGAKNRSEQLPLFPDLYLAKKPSLIMTKFIDFPPHMIILRLWSSQLSLQPGKIPLWLGTVKLHEPWRWHHNPKPTNMFFVLSPVTLIQNDLSNFSTKSITLDSPSCLHFCQENLLKILGDHSSGNRDND